MKQLIAAALVLWWVTALPAHPQGDAKADADLTGRWTLALEGPAVHGVTTLGLTLTQKEARVTGTFASPHGDMHVEGEFSNGTLNLATVDAEGDQQITFTAKLKDDGTLAGFMSSQMGDMKWTATRVKGD